MAKIDGIPIFHALWTCMDSCYIQAQALTLTKAHEERVGPLLGVAKSVRLYGYDGPSVVFSDDPVKVSVNYLNDFTTLEHASLGQTATLFCLSCSCTESYTYGSCSWLGTT
jgi:hypothetical protein